MPLLTVKMWPNGILCFMIRIDFLFVSFLIDLETAYLPACAGSDTDENVFDWFGMSYTFIENITFNALPSRMVAKFLYVHRVVLCTVAGFSSTSDGMKRSNRGLWPRPARLNCQAWIGHIDALVHLDHCMPDNVHANMLFPVSVYACVCMPNQTKVKDLPVTVIQVSKIIHL